MTYGLSSVSLVLAVIVFGSSAYTQSLPSPPGQEQPAAVFEVTSVKENHLTRRESGGYGIRGMLPSGRYEARYVTLRQLILVAYGVRAYQIVEGPDWIQTARFDIAAKAPDNFDPRQTNAMLRRLLEDRFRLVVRKEMRRMPTYSLEWVGGGRKPGPGIRTPSPRCDDLEPLRPNMPASPAECQGGIGSAVGWIYLRRGPLSSFVAFLDVETGRPVIDRTGLTGTYNIDLKWSPEPRALFAEIPGGVPDFGGGVSIFTAVREQLGLKLQTADDDVDVLVVVRAESPMPD
jgi:uncharacterized protein (TIGR03435 family)